MHNWDCLWLNCNIVTAINDNYTVILNAAIAIKDEKIVFADKKEKLPANFRKNTAHIFDANGKYFTPGFIDCHTHSVFSDYRSTEYQQRLHGVSYSDIAKAGGGILNTVHTTRALSFDELYHKAEKRVNNFIKNGVTTVEIKSGYGLDLKTEIKMLKVIAALQHRLPLNIYPTYLGAHALAPEFDNTNAYIDFIIAELLPTIAKKNLAKAVDLYCEKIAFSDIDMLKLFNACDDYNFDLKAHVGQFSATQAPQIAAKLKAVSCDHLEYITDESLSAMQQAGMVAVLLPAAFYFLHETKTPPITKLKELAIPIAIATDYNPGTSPCSSILLAMHFAGHLWRMQFKDIFLGVTINAAKALKMSDSIGSIEVNKKADLALWDIKDISELTYHLGYSPLALLLKDNNTIFGDIENYRVK